MKYGFVIPVYRHGATLESVVKSLAGFEFPIIVVDDGNDEENRNLIAAVAQKYPLVTVVTRPKNGGKGRAMISGIYKAHEMGLTHILQLDSDGQHDAARADRFFELSRQNPDAIICGYPQYDATAPKSRVNGRKFANGWIHIVTLSGQIKDAMIGFRIYPVAPFVKMYWRGVPVISEPVKVFYPADGISNYHYFKDTLRLTSVYSRLCIGMIFHAPLLLFRKIRNAGKTRGTKSE